MNAAQTGFRARHWPVVWPILCALGVLWAFNSAGRSFFNGYELDLGSLVVPSVRHAYFLLYWGVLGTLAALLLTLGVARGLARTGAAKEVQRAWGAVPDRFWIAGATASGFLVPAVVRALVLNGAPLTDDESAYRFMAECLASGRLYADSPPMKLFFDNAFLINDGKLYSQYFLGWPALMVPGVWLGITGYMNCLYSALTVPGVFLIFRRLLGGPWAKLATVLYLSAPMLMVGAATELSHTSCLMALVWTFWFVLRSRDQGAPTWTHTATALAFCVAFFIRPTTTLGVGGPLLVYWAAGLWSDRRSKERRKALAAFAFPACLMAGLFLGINHAQNGSSWQVSYQEYHVYSKANGYRFSAAQPGREVANLAFDSVGTQAAKMGTAWIRLNQGLLGWPLMLPFLFLAGSGIPRRLGWAMLLAFMGLHFFAVDSGGVDTYGPNKYSETFMGVTLLILAGASRTTVLAKRLAQDGTIADSWRIAPVCFVCAMTTLGWAGYVPPRFGALGRISGNVMAPLRAVESAGLSKAVIFYTRPWASQEPIAPTRHFVFWRPNNDPDLNNDILWVNHLTVEHDKQLMRRRFSDRKGYVMSVDRNNNVRFLLLEQLQPGSVPRGRIGGTNRISLD